MKAHDNPLAHSCYCDDCVVIVRPLLYSSMWEMQPADLRRVLGYQGMKIPNKLGNSISMITFPTTWEPSCCS